MDGPSSIAADEICLSPEQQKRLVMAEAVSVERLADVGMAYLERSRLACLLDRSDAELQRCVTAARAALRTRDSELAKLLEEMVVPDGEWTYLPAECKLVRAQ